MVARASQQAHYLHTGRRWQINWRLLWTWMLLLACVSLLALGVRKLQEPQTLPIKQIQALGTFNHINEDMLRQVVAKTVRGGYFTVNVDEVQQAVKALDDMVKSAAIIARRKARKEEREKRRQDRAGR